MEYIKPSMTIIDMKELTVMLRCSCSRDDLNPYR